MQLSNHEPVDVSTTNPRVCPTCNGGGNVQNDEGFVVGCDPCDCYGVLGLVADAPNRVTLPDGSEARTLPLDFMSTRVWREVNGEVVWGQVFAQRDDHLAQIANVIVSMWTNPAGFIPWYSETEGGCI